MQAQINFDSIATAIDYLKNNFPNKPTLEEAAVYVNLSPFHFQKMFKEWAGVSPEKFLEYISISYAKSLLNDKQLTLFGAAINVGLSSTNRLHNLFVSIESITHNEYKNTGENINIEYCFAITHFGKVIIASTQKGICHIAFINDEKQAIFFLQKIFSKSTLVLLKNAQHEKVIKFFENNLNPKDKIKLHLKGTAFQLKIWETLLTIPMGRLSTYGAIAKAIQNPKAARAVGTAIGDNPIAYLIPCHRVIQASGIFGGYMWGAKRKAAIIGWEAAKMS